MDRLALRQNRLGTHSMNTWLLEHCPERVREGYHLGWQLSSAPLTAQPESALLPPLMFHLTLELLLSAPFLAFKLLKYQVILSHHALFNPDQLITQREKTFGRSWVHSRLALTISPFTLCQSRFYSPRFRYLKALQRSSSLIMSSFFSVLLTPELHGFHQLY